VKGFHFSFKALWPDKRVLRAALPFAIIILLMSFHYRLDGFLLERLSSAAEAGKYAGAYRLLDAANMIGYLLTSFLLPYIARHHSDGNMMTGVILNVRHILVVFSLSISSIVVFMAPWIQKTLYHHNDASYVEVMQWCIPALLFYSLLQIYGSVMTATGKINAFILITFISVVINITVNLFLIPTLGAKGSCIAAICSQAFCGLASMWYCRQKLQVPLDTRSWLIYVLTGCLVAGFLYLSSYLAINRLVVMLAAGMIALILLWLTKLINLKNWKQYING
jgi:O-antigen/teichoic acid export membrane protein